MLLKNLYLKFQKKNHPAAYKRLITVLAGDALVSVSNVQLSIKVTRPRTHSTGENPPPMHSGPIIAMHYHLVAKTGKLQRNLELNQSPFSQERFCS